MARSGCSPLLRRSGWVFSCCCAAVAARRVGLRKGLDRRTGPGSGGSAGRGSGGRKVLRSCVGAPRMLRSWSDPVVNAASFGLQHAKAESCVRWGDGARRWGRDSPFSRTVPRKGRIPAPTGAKSSPRCFLREARSTRRTNRARVPRRGRIVAVPRRPTRAQSPCSGRGPFGKHAHSQPQQRSSRREPSRSSAAGGRGAARRPPGPCRASPGNDEAPDAVAPGASRRAAGQAYSDSSPRMADLGRTPTIDFTTSPL